MEVENRPLFCFILLYFLLLLFSLSLSLSLLVCLLYSARHCSTLLVYTFFGLVATLFVFYW